MGSSDRREREKRELRSKILDAARLILKEEGYEAITIRRLAERIEYSPMALYYHFPDKTSILIALAREVFLQLDHALPAAGKNPLETLRKGLLTYASFALSHPDEYQLVLMNKLPTGEFLHDDAGAGDEGAGRQAFSRLVAYVQTCVEAGLIQRDPTEAAMMFWAGIHGVVALLLTGRQGPFRRKMDFAKSMVQVLLRGVLHNAALP